MKLFIVEDQVLFREVMIHNLRTHLPVEICGAYSDPFAALDGFETIAQSDVGLVDLRMEKGDTLELVAKIRRDAPQVKMIWMTSVVEDFLFEQAYSLRLPGFVHKNDSSETLRKAVSTVGAGQVFISDRVRSIHASIKSKPNHYALILSQREQEVLRYIGSGLSNEEAGAFMGLSGGTIQSHRRNIMKRLELHTAAELITYSVQNGFCDPSALRIPD